jgi:hypothetical protein
MAPRWCSTHGLKNIDELGNLIQQHVTELLLPRAVNAISAGRTLEFGMLGVDQNGIAYKREVLSWQNIESIQVKKGKLIIRENGKWLDWTSISVADIPNLFVFLHLVHALREVNRKV